MFVTKKKYEELYDKYQNLTKQCQNLADEVAFFKEQFHKDDAKHKMKEIELNRKISELEESIHEEKQKNVFSDENVVSLHVDDSLTKVTPRVLVKEDVFEKMVELHYLNDAVNSETKAMAMQLALMMIANESLDQIIDSFSSPVDDGD